MYVLCKYFLLFFVIYVNNSRHSPETFPSPVKAVIWIEYLDSPLILRCSTVRSRLHTCCYLVFILVESVPEICYSLRPSKNGCGLLTTYPHLTTHRPKISFHQFPLTIFTHFQGTQCQHVALSDNSPLKGPVSISKQWCHHHLHQAKNMHDTTMDLVWN